jgi:hypothetical protein
MTRRSGGALAVVLVLAVALSACGISQRDKQTGACPRFLILGGANELTRFKPGPRRDQTDVAFRATVADFNGTCEYDKNTVRVKLYVVFDILRGPAPGTREAEFDYFVALPQFHPAPEGKRVFPVKARFERDLPRLAYRDGVDLAIPIKDNELGADYEVYLGFQLDSEEIEYNRAHRR